MAITRVQTNHAEAAASLTTIAVSLTGIAPGALVVVTLTCDTSAGATVLSVKDDLNVAATSRAAINSATFNQRKEIWRFQNHGGGTRTFTATFSAAATNRGIVAVEYAGAHATAVDDGVASASGTGTTPSSGNIVPAPSVAGELIVGGITSQSLPTPASPFGEVFQDATNVGDTDDYIQPAAAAIAATWTQASGAYSAIAASFMPAAGTTGPNGDRYLLEAAAGVLLLEAAAGALLLEALTGNIAKAIPMLTMAASAAVDVVGSLARAIPMVTMLASAAVNVDGTVPARGVPMQTMTAQATVATSGVIAKPLPMLTLASVGAVATNGAMTAVIPMITEASAGTVPISGTHAPIIPMQTMAASATVPITGTIAKPVPMQTLAAAGSVGTVIGGGTITILVPMLTTVASASVATGGVLAPSVPMLVFTSAGSSSSQPSITGVLAGRIPMATITMSGTALFPAPPIVDLPLGATRVVFDASRTTVRFDASRTLVTLDPSRTRVS